MGTASVPVVVREQVDRWARAWLERTFARRLELRACDPDRFNYPVAVFGEWRGQAFYLCVRYRSQTRERRTTLDDFRNWLIREAA